MIVALIVFVRKKKGACFILGFFVFSLLGTIPGYTYRHYFAQIAPSVAVASGFGYSFIINAVSNKKYKIVITILCFLSIFVMPLSIYSDYYFKMKPSDISRKYFSYNPFPESYEIAKFISRHTNPDDYVFIVGSEPQILFMSQRKSVTPHIFFYPLLQSFPRHKEFQKSVLEQINKNLPKYIIFVDISTSLMWDEKADMLILNQVGKIIQKDYIIESMMLIGEKTSKMITDFEADGFSKKELGDYRYKVYLYHLKR